jgi:hypothetical protein
MLRLGPVVEALQSSIFFPTIIRCFNIAQRKGHISELPPQLEQLAGEYKITVISPLAVAQRAVALTGITTFLQGIGQMSQFDQRALDRIDIDKTVDHWADISGAPSDIIVPVEEANKIREQRMQAQAAQQKKAEEMAQMKEGSSAATNIANAYKARAEAGNAAIEGQQMAQEMGAV